MPVALDGPQRILPRGTFRARPGTVRMAVGEPILTAGLTRDERAALAERAQREVEAMLEWLRSPDRG